MSTVNEPSLQALMNGTVSALEYSADGQLRPLTMPPRAVLPGSFNPLHQGHLKLAQTAEQLLGCPVWFGMSPINAEKPQQSPEELGRRLQQFRGIGSVLLTRADTFAQQALVVPGVVFVVGMDTAARVGQLRFYNNDPSVRERALEQLRACGCRFLVAGRVNAQGRFLSLGDIDLPVGYEDLFQAIPETMFRADVSSTQLRQAGWQIGPVEA